MRHYGAARRGLSRATLLEKAGIALCALDDPQRLV